LLMQCKGEVIAINLIPVRHKRHMQFLPSAPNFIGGQLTPDPAFSEPLKRGRSCGGSSLPLSLICCRLL